MNSIDILIDNSNVIYPVENGSVVNLLGSILHDEHLRLLQKSNGLFSVMFGIHIFGFGEDLQVWHDIKQWNDNNLWKNEYPEPITEICFSETLLGDQFFYGDSGRIGKLEAETGHKKIIANNFVEWLDLLKNSVAEFTDKDIFCDWAKLSGQNIEPGFHLCPRIPFCLGGSIERSSDGYLCNSIDNMKFKGQLASQLSSLKPGDKVDLKVINFPKNITFFPQG